MDHQFLEREKELFKLNAKLNARTKRIQVIGPAKPKPVQIHTANNNLNYEEPSAPQKEPQHDGPELMCKKITISNQPIKKPQEIVYPLFNRQTAKISRDANLDLHIHLPTGSLIPDGECDADVTSETVESMSFKNESVLTRYSDDSSAIPPAVPPADVLLPDPPNLGDVIPKTIDKKNISNDGLQK